MTFSASTGLARFANPKALDRLRMYSFTGLPPRRSLTIQTSRHPLAVQADRTIRNPEFEGLWPMMRPERATAKHPTPRITREP